MRVAPMVRVILGLAVGGLLAVSGVAAERVRESALAGSWYPGDPQELATYVDGLLDAAGAQSPAEPVRALIAPHAGYMYSGAAAAEVFARIRGSEYRRVMVLAPSHRAGFAGLSIADVDAYETPLGAVPLDSEAVAGLRDSELVVSDPEAHVREHAIEIELPMLQRSLAPGWRLLPVLVGRLEPHDYAAAAGLLAPWADDETLVVVSSDFTHYGERFGYLPFPPDHEAPDRIRALDDGAIERIIAADGPALLAYQHETGVTICGYRPLALLLHMLPADARIERVAYATSGELTGDWRHSVSYVAIVVSGPSPLSASGRAATDGAGVGAQDLRLLHRVAVLGVERAVRGPSERREAEIRRLLSGLPEHLYDPGGVFVTLKKDGRLRGCVGYILPRKSLCRAALENGANAAVNDRRFPPVAPGELGDLNVEVSVLSPPRPIATVEEFRPGEQGIILRKGDRAAVFLPEVASEQGWTREETLTQLARKARLPDDGWREGASLEVFSSTRYAAPFSSEESASEPLRSAAGATHSISSTRR